MRIVLLSLLFLSTYSFGGNVYIVKEKLGYVDTNFKDISSTKTKALNSRNGGTLLEVVSQTANYTKVRVILVEGKEPKEGDYPLLLIGSRFFNSGTRLYGESVVKAIQKIADSAGTLDGSCSIEELDFVDTKKAKAVLERDLADDHARGAGTYLKMKAGVLAAAKGKSGEDKIRACDAYIKRNDPIWGGLSTSQKAERIFAHSSQTARLLRVNPDTYDENSNRGPKSSYEKLNDPNYIHSLIKPHITSCIAYREASPTLSSNSLNHYYCYGKSKQFSSYSLSMATKTTIRGLRSFQLHPGQVKNQIPITTIKDYDYSKLSDTEFFAQMGDDVPLQMELIYRILADKVRHNRNNIFCGIRAYNGGSEKDQYLLGIFSCMDCFQRHGKNNYMKCVQASHRKKFKTGDPISDKVRHLISKCK